MSTITAIIAVFKAWTAINAAVSGRIYGVEIGGGIDKLPALMIRRIGGQSPRSGQQPIHQVVVAIHCLAETQLAADAVIATLTAQLNGSPAYVAGGYRLSGISERQGPVDVVRAITEAKELYEVMVQYDMAVSTA